MHRRSAAAVILLSVLSLAGCASPVVKAAATPSAPASIDNCGTQVDLGATPQRIVTIKSSTLELLLTLGLGDRVVGTAYSDGPLPSGLTSDAPVMSDKVPSEEAVLAIEPDMIFAGWESNVSDEGVGSRESLAKLGVATYVAPSACQEPGYAPDPLTFDDVFAGFTEAGEVFGASDAAAELVATDRAKLDAITPDERGLTAVWYSSGKDKPFVGGGTGAPELIMSTAGLTNAFASIESAWGSTSWEAVAEADPDVLVLVDSSWNTAASKIAMIEANPVLSHLRAVQNHAYVIVDFPATEAGVRTVDAVADVVAQLP